MNGRKRSPFVVLVMIQPVVYKNVWHRVTKNLNCQGRVSVMVVTIVRTRTKYIISSSKVSLSKIVPYTAVPFSVSGYKVLSCQKRLYVMIGLVVHKNSSASWSTNS